MHECEFLLLSRRVVDPEVTLLLFGTAVVLCAYQVALVAWARARQCAEGEGEAKE